jgi:hypothetical protein
MRGMLVKYVEDYAGYKSIGIVIEYRVGYHLRKSWSDKKELIEEPLVKIYWLNAPTITPETAKISIMGDHNSNEESQQNLFDPNIIIDEWGELSDDWHLASFFEPLD